MESDGSVTADVDAVPELLGLMFMGTLQPLITGLAGGTPTFIFPLPASDNREPELKEEPRLPRLLRADPGNGATSDCSATAAVETCAPE
mmetsp:Transcript_11965/g.30711  ORF Transcript_11965/g.30711 Transcript_11965/m.30711 type:complete len:89 (-) Transcript_11965:651-917(-)